MPSRLIIAVVLAVFLITASLIAAQMPKMGMSKGAGIGMSCDWAHGKIARELNLSEDQMAKIKQIHTEFFNATKNTREQLKAKWGQMSELWSVDHPDATAIKSLLADMDPLKAELRSAAIDHAIRAFDVLTPAQKTKARQMVKTHVSHMREGCGKCSGDMGCGVGETQY